MSRDELGEDHIRASYRPTGIVQLYPMPAILRPVRPTAPYTKVRSAIEAQMIRRIWLHRNHSASTTPKRSLDLHPP